MSQNNKFRTTLPLKDLFFLIVVEFKLLVISLFIFFVLVYGTSELMFLFDIFFAIIFAVLLAILSNLYYYGRHRLWFALLMALSLLYSKFAIDFIRDSIKSGQPVPSLAIFLLTPFVLWFLIFLFYRTKRRKELKQLRTDS